MKNLMIASNGKLSKDIAKKIEKLTNYKCEYDKYSESCIIKEDMQEEDAKFLSMKIISIFCTSIKDIYICFIDMDKRENIFTYNALGLVCCKKD